MLQDAGELRRILRVQHRDQSVLVGDVGGEGVVDQRASGVGQRDQAAPAVDVGSRACDEAPLDEA